MPSVFVCHSSVDKPTVRRIRGELERHGHSVWLDENAIKVGQSLSESVQIGLEQADFVLVVLNNAALRRPWVKRELNAAYTLEAERNAALILPVVLERTSLPLFLRDKKYADLSRDFRRGIDEILEVLNDKWRAGTPLELETTSCTVTLDILTEDGTLVVYTKSQRLRARVAGARTYTEAWSPDGTLDDFEVEPGQITRIWRESGTVHVETEFPAPLKAGQTTTREFRCNWLDSFTESEEYWDQRQHHPSRNVTVMVRFPVNRPPRSWRVEEREGALARPSGHKATLIEENGLQVLRLFVRTPRLFRSYVLRWTW